MSLDFHTLFSGIRPIRKTFAAGDVIMRAGDKAEGVYTLDKGRAALTRSGITVHRALPGSLFGESALFAEINLFDAHAEIGTKVSIYPQLAVLLHLRAHPDLNMAFSAYLARGLDEQRLRLELASTRSAPQRVRAYFRQLGAAEHWVELDRPLMRVAAELGLTHEAFYRTLRKLTDAGELQRRGRRGFYMGGDHEPG